MNSPLKRLIPLAIILLLGGLAIFTAQRRHVAKPAGPQALLSAAADAQHELTRIPAHLDPLSDADEIRIGDELASHYDQGVSATKSSPQKAAVKTEIEAYLQRVALRAAAHTRRHLPWRVHYIADPNFINAFALPGGHIFVGEGLLRLMHSEDALAAVLGHEIEHIDLRHCAERVQTEEQLKNFGGLLSLPVEIFIAGYSKEQEFEADRDGTTLAVQAGYSPQGILQLFGEFAKLEQRYAPANSSTKTNPIDETLHLSLATLSGYFASHPPAAARIQQIEALIATNDWASPPLTPLSEVVLYEALLTTSRLVITNLVSVSALAILRQSKSISLLP
jgi:predicted Zn-dependent protease